MTAERTAGQVRSGPVVPSEHSTSVLRPLTLGDARINGGFWASRQHINRESTLPAGRARLEKAGNLHNLGLAAGTATGAYAGPFFMDSDLYKWLEALAWEQGREPSAQLAALQQEVTESVSRAQAPDGYLNTFVQTGHAERWADLAHGHELYCAGHLLQAAVAQLRATGERGLLDVAQRFADLLVATFGPGKLEDIDGHPGIEVGLAELSRVTDRPDYLELARWFVDARGHGTIDSTGTRSAYYSDRIPVRETLVPEGHAVRALYLAAGATDVATETGDADLVEALRTQWQNMVDAKTYLTGGVGSRWDDEAFGAPYELPPDRAYCETCAAYASVMFSWRLLLATGDGRYADLIERTLYNGFLSGLSLDGQRFFYVNALQLRAGTVSADHREPVNGRQDWYDVACCPPNIMRALPCLDTYLATSDAQGLQVHQFTPSTLAADLPTGRAQVAVVTDYPWDGEVHLTVMDTPDQPWTLSLRVPSWCDDAHVEITAASGGVETGPSSAANGYLSIDRSWSMGDRVTLTLPLEPRVTDAGDCVDAVRGCVAFERGPLVYCFEQADQPDAVAVDDLRWDEGSVSEQRMDGLLGGIIALHTTARVGRDGPLVEVIAVPYYTWANRDVGPMRVWVPVGRARVGRPEIG